MSNSPTLQFDEALHQYTVDNQLQPHVTGILEQYGLIDYSGVPARTLERKSLLGTIVHDVTHVMDEDGINFNLALGFALDTHREQCAYYELGSMDVDPYCRAYTRFKAESGFEIFAGYIERRHVAEVNGMRYGMTADRAGLLAKKPTVFDLKCCRSIEKSWPVQLAGYSLGLPRPANVARWERAGLWLKPDATYSILPGGRQATDRVLERRDDEIFLAALRLAHWKLENLGHL